MALTFIVLTVVVIVAMNLGFRVMHKRFKTRLDGEH